MIAGVALAHSLSSLQLYCDLVPEAREYLTVDPPAPEPPVSNAAAAESSAASVVSDSEVTSATDSLGARVQPFTLMDSALPSPPTLDIGPVDKPLEELDDEERAFVQTLRDEKVGGGVGVGLWGKD